MEKVENMTTGTCTDRVVLEDAVDDLREESNDDLRARTVPAVLHDKPDSQSRRGQRKQISRYSESPIISETPPQGALYPEIQIRKYFRGDALTTRKDKHDLSVGSNTSL